MHLPQALVDPDDDTRAIKLLQEYYSCGPYVDSKPYTGARFDEWDSTGTRHADQNRFTADDLVAVSFLSVQVPASAAIQLLDTRVREFERLLTELGADRDLKDETDLWKEGWAGTQLWDSLVSLPGVAATTASKLFARKRPRLRPIYDSVVAEVIGTQNVWAAMHDLLTTHPEIHDRLLRLREQSGAPSTVSALRVFDVVAWMEGSADNRAG